MALSTESIPRYAIYKRSPDIKGNRVRVLEYFKKDLFFILDKGDTKRLVNRKTLTFLPDKKAEQ